MFRKSGIDICVTFGVGEITRGFRPIPDVDGGQCGVVYGRPVATRKWAACERRGPVPSRLITTSSAPFREIIAGSAAGGLGVDLRINHARCVPRRAQSACPVRPVNRGITQCPRRRRRRLGPRCVRHSLHHAIGRPRRIAAVVPRTFRCGSNRTTRGRYAVIQGSGSTCRFDQSELPDFINRREN